MHVSWFKTYYRKHSPKIVTSADASSGPYPPSSTHLYRPLSVSIALISESVCSPGTSDLMKNLLRNSSTRTPLPNSLRSSWEPVRLYIQLTGTSVELVHQLNWYISWTGTSVELVHQLNWYIQLTGTSVELVTHCKSTVSPVFNTALTGLRISRQWTSTITNENYFIFVNVDILEK